MMELRPGFAHFICYEVLISLLVTTSAVINLIIGMLTKHIMSGILVATIVMIHFLMLTNLFINFGKHQCLHAYPRVNYSSVQSSSYRHCLSPQTR